MAELLPFRAASILSCLHNVAVVTNSAPAKKMLRTEPFPWTPKVSGPGLRVRKGVRNDNGCYSSEQPKMPHQPVHPTSPSSCRKGVAELSAALKFDDDVVLTWCPERISYKKACEINPLQVPLESRQTRKPMGRHNCRGEPKRHILCHLRSRSLPVEEEASHLRPSSRPPLTILDERSAGLGTSESVSGYRHTLVPVAPSTKWEEQTLLRLSSDTAHRWRQAGGTSSPAFLKPAEPSRSAELRPLREETESSSLDGNPRNPERGESSTSPCYLSALLAGARPVHGSHSCSSTIVLDDQSRFQKVVQEKFPQTPHMWCPTGSERQVKKKHTKGVRRWTDLPKPAETPERLKWTCQQLEDTSPEAGNCVQHPTLPDNEKFFRIRKQNTVQEWCQRWHVAMDSLELKETFFAGSLLSLSNADQISRVAALVMMKRASPSAEGGGCGSGEDGKWTTEALCGLLNGTTERVRVCGALALYCLGQHVDKAEQVLMAALESQSLPESWAAAQCLSLAGSSDDAAVIRYLIHTLVQDEDPARVDQVKSLLVDLSSRTSLVNAEVAVLLNSDGWQNRAIGCSVLGDLHGGLNRDVSERLSYLMWEDPSKQVRLAAAEAICKTVGAKVICDEVRKRLVVEVGVKRLAALKMLHTMQLMTPQLLPAYLMCFKDEYASVKMEAIMIAGSLKLQNGQVIQALTNLLNDPCWKVKAQTLRALGDIGWYNDAIVDQLLWAVRFEKLATVRAEACHAIGMLGARQDRVVKTLKDLLIVEEDPLVKSNVCEVLTHLGYDTQTEDSSFETICAEIHRLGTLQSIQARIIEDEEVLITKYVLERSQELPSTRDYLNSELRDRLYQRTKVSERKTRDTSEPLTNGTEHRQTWSPDQATINAQLEGIRSTIAAQCANLIRRSTTKTPDLIQLLK